MVAQHALHKLPTDTIGSTPSFSNIANSNPVNLESRTAQQPRPLYPGSHSPELWKKRLDRSLPQSYRTTFVHFHLESHLWSIENERKMREKGSSSRCLEPAYSLFEAAKWMTSTLRPVRISASGSFVANAMVETLTRVCCRRLLLNLTERKQSAMTAQLYIETSPFEYLVTHHDFTTGLFAYLQAKMTPSLPKNSCSLLAGRFLAAGVASSSHDVSLSTKEVTYSSSEMFGNFSSASSKLHSRPRLT